MDETAVKLAAQQTRAIVTVEEHLLQGGLGTAVAMAMARQQPVPMRFVGLDNQYAESGDPEALLKKYNLMPQDIVRAVREVIEQK
jgi:transketolase